MTELVIVRQRLGSSDHAPWIVEGGRTVPGQDHNGRIEAVDAGLSRHPAVRAATADAADDDVERALATLHEPEYVAALRALDADEHVVLPQFAPPGMEPDTAVGRDLVAAAHEGLRTAIAAAQRVAAGARFAYALCRPPGHHAGPGWLAGYCYFNNAAAAAHTLREAGLRPVGILDLDLHYPNGTSAIVAAMPDARLHSLHAWPVTNAPEDPVLPKTERESLVEFRDAPDAERYLDAVASSVAALACCAEALVVSLGYDIVRGDPHGSWELAPSIFTEIGRLLAASGLPICVVQEGGYAVDALADCGHAFAIGLLEEHAA